MLQNVDGLDVYVVDITEPPLTLLPIHDGGERYLRPYADALDAAIRTGVITKPGKYGIYIDHVTNRWEVHLIIE